MKLKLSIAGLMALGMFAAATEVRAHHSDAVYDMTQMKVLKGMVTEHQFINPHQIIKLKVKDADGKVTPWILVGAAVSANRDAGWTRDTLKAGEEITVYGFPYRDGKPNMTWMRIVNSQGKLLPISGAKNDKLGRYLGTYGKEQLSREDYEVFRESIKNEGLSNSEQR